MQLPLVLKAVIERAGIQPQQVEDVVVGNVLAEQVGFCNRSLSVLRTTLAAASFRFRFRFFKSICHPNALQAAVVARLAQLFAGIPEHVPVASLNRQCSSGLQVSTLIRRLNSIRPFL